ncbi:MAG: glutaredoxin family protein [Myxococcaceae bacterium]|nr:glutaredoxin family protein [Myxococcaceae bacterium]
MQVTFYTKAGCPLCEEAEELLDEARDHLPLEIEKLDILRDDALFQRYRYRVPVIRVGNTDVLELKFTLDELLRVLSK